MHIHWRDTMAITKAIRELILDIRNPLTGQEEEDLVMIKLFDAICNARIIEGDKNEKATDVE